MRKNYKWSVCIITLLITLLLLTGGQTLWKKYVFAKPLDQAIQTVEGVESVQLADGKKSESLQIIDITLNNVPSLQTTYQSLQDTIQNVLGNKKYKIVLHDHRTPELEHFYYAIHYAIQEAIFTGKFTTMSDLIQEKAAASGIQTQIYVDAKYVYLQLSKDNGHMYMLIPRQPDKQEVK